MRRSVTLLIGAVVIVRSPRTVSAQGCGMRQLMQHLDAVDSACCSDANCAGDSPVPDRCSASCAEVFVPFWDSCAPMLSSEGDAEAEAYARFSLTCLHSVSPPGSCGAECTAANFRCRHNEIRLACCEEDHDCVELSGAGTSLGSAGRFSPPTACGFECSLVLPAFWEACEPYMASELRDVYNAADLASFASAAQACENQDPVDLLDTLYEKQFVTGCVLHTAGLSHGDASHDAPPAYSAIRVTVTRAHGASAVCYDDLHLLNQGEMLDWALYDPTATDSGNWGNAYPAGNVLDEGPQYCSEQGSFTPNPVDNGVTSVASEPESVTLVFQTPATFDQFQLAQNDGMGYNPMDFVLEGQAVGSDPSSWTTLLQVTNFDFTTSREVHTWSLSTRGEPAYSDIGPGYCSDWVYLPEGGYPARLAVTERLNNADPIQECMNRCLSVVGARGADSASGAGISNQAFYIRDGERCACSSGSCAVQSGGANYHSYRIVAPTAGRRRAQFGRGIIPAVEDECPVSVMNERLAEVDAACCPPDHPCEGAPVPDSCPIACAIAWSPLYSLCADTLQRMIGGPDQMTVFERFQQTCINGVDVDELLAIARSASCGLESCQAHKLADPMASDGVYPITTADGHTYMAFCDMTTSGGGWELVLRASSAGSVFTWDSDYWTSSTLLDSNVDDRFRIGRDTDAKFEGFLYSPVDEIRGCLQGRTPDDCKVYTSDDLGGVEYSSLQELFSTAPVGSQGIQFPETTADAQQWLAINGMSCADTSDACNWVAGGINLADDQSEYQAAVRFGILMNNQNNIVTANDAVGFGVREANGESIGAGQAKYPNLVNPSSGTIWVRGRAAAPPPQRSEFLTRPEQPACDASRQCGSGHFCGAECWSGPCERDLSVCQPCEECHSDSDAVDGSCSACGQGCVQAQIASCSASSEFSDQYHCEFAYDGVTSTRGGHADEGTTWATRGEGVGSWIELTFATPQRVNTMKYANRDSYGDSGQEANHQVRLDFSDGSSTTVDLLPVENEDFDHFYSFPAVTTTSVHITVLSTYGTVNNGAEEIAFFSCADVNAFEVTEVWSAGGCENFDSISAENPVRVLDDQDYTLETCAAVCEELEWCTHIFVGQDSTHMGVTTTNSRCIPVGDGCTQSSDHSWRYYRVSSMNTGAEGRETLELTDTAWEHAGAVVFGEETTLACGQNCGAEVWMQSRDTFTRPVSVTAEIKADTAECITMSLFADSHEKNAPYSIETGGWATNIRVFPGDYREIRLEQEVGRNDHWHTVRIEATSDGQVRYSLDDVVKYTVTDTSLQSGKIQFIPGCVGMTVRNVVVAAGGCDMSLIRGHACEGQTLEDVDIDGVDDCAAACKANARCNCISMHETGWGGGGRCRLENDGGAGHTDRGVPEYSAMTMAEYDACRAPSTDTGPKSGGGGSGH